MLLQIHRPATRSTADLTLLGRIHRPAIHLPRCFVSSTSWRSVGPVQARLPCALRVVDDGDRDQSSPVVIHDTGAAKTRPVEAEPFGDLRRLVPAGVECRPHGQRSRREPRDVHGFIEAPDDTVAASSTFGPPTPSSGDEPTPIE